MKSVGLLLASACAAFAQFAPRPVPLLQAVPLPHHQISFQRGGVELARYHFDPADKRPFLFPLHGPSGVPLTRMGHPHDPVGHSHHNSQWVAHHDVNGISFWGDTGSAKIRHVRIEEFTDGDDTASATVFNAWGDTNRTHLFERRRMTVRLLPDGEWLLLLDLRFEAGSGPAVLGKTPFGITAVRMAKSIGVHDGGGTIRNSAGGVNEKEVFWKPARWVDYSGAVTTNAVEGITLFDHPANPGHPAVFHVRDDGWMGASLTFSNAIAVPTNQPLELRYGLYIHRGLTAPRDLDAQWLAFTKIPRRDMDGKKAAPRAPGVPAGSAPRLTPPPPR
jgi:hypothetical protein